MRRPLLGGVLIGLALLSTAPAAAAVQGDVPPSAPPPTDPAQAAADLANQFVLPSADIQTQPKATVVQLVGNPIWLWLDAASTAVVTATVDVAGDVVVVKGELAQTDFDMGDGSVVTCPGGGTPYDVSKPDAAQASTCTHTYTASSVGQPGDRYVVGAHGEWRFTWTDAAHLSDQPLDGVRLSDGSVRLRVGEAEGLNTGGAVPGLDAPGTPPPSGCGQGAVGPYCTLTPAKPPGHSWLDRATTFGAGLIHAPGALAGDVAHWGASAWNATAHCFTGPGHTCLKYVAIVGTGAAVLAGCLATVGVGCVVAAGVAAGGLAGGLFCHGGSMLGCVAKGAVSGGLAGALLSIEAAGILGAAALGGAAGFTGTLVDELLNGGHIHPKALILNTVLMALTAGLLKGVQLRLAPEVPAETPPTEAPPTESPPTEAPPETPPIGGDDGLGGELGPDGVYRTPEGGYVDPSDFDRSEEVDTARRLLKLDPTHQFEGPAGDKTIDFLDVSKNPPTTYEQIGNPNTSQYWSQQREQFLRQISAHFKGADQVVLDLNGFTRDQIAEIMQHVNSLDPTLRQKLIVLGAQ